MAGTGPFVDGAGMVYLLDYLKNYVDENINSEYSDHTHEIADINGLQDALDGKAALSHTHTTSDITDLMTLLADYATKEDLEDVSGGSESIDTSNFYQKNASLIPSSNGSYSLGSSSYRFNYAYLNYLLVNSYVASDLVPSSTSGAYDLGTSSRPWGELYAGDYTRSTTGYTSLPNGLLIQWGRLSLSSSSATWVNVTFPVSFSAVYSAFATMEDIDETSYAHTYIYPGSLSTTGMQTRVFDYNSSIGTRYTYWMAIGRE